MLFLDADRIFSVMSPADAVNALCADPARAAAYGAAGRARAVADFSWESIAAQTLDVYRHAIAARG